MLRAEEDFANWTSTREIANDLMGKGYHGVSPNIVYRHCVSLNLDIKRVKNIERGVSRIVDRGMTQLEEGSIQLKASDLIMAITLQARLGGLLSDNQNTTNVLIRNNMTALEDIAKIKDPTQLQERATQIFKQLSLAGAVPGVTVEQANFNEMRELVAAKTKEKEGRNEGTET